MRIRHLRIASKLPLLNSLIDSTTPFNLEALPKGIAQRFDVVNNLYCERTNLIEPNRHSRDFWHNDYTIRVDLVESLTAKYSV
ncbi:hypothetical protein LCM02_09090 [Lutimonas saemankumensis]|uniref:hypothetical protein n=1 Tax=Lutimonas saemankumensis TaxID=483016 RepID=UPI001CD4BCA7|nr:hypothetical protein [Lutimonas saemankumensis]MCA0932604.1 hypothetical protein [Lutimonas saemankumensis]